MSNDGSGGAGGAGGAGGNSVKDWADSVKATVDAIKAVQDLLSSPRSVIIEVDNATGRTTPGITLLQIASQHDHGGFAKTPSSVIGPKSSDVYGSQSTGFATGTEGSVTYDGGNGMQLKVYWDNPFIGGNSSNASLSGKHTKRYSTLADTGSGNQDANMRYVLLDMQDFNNGAWSVKIGPSRRFRRHARVARAPIGSRADEFARHAGTVARVQREVAHDQGSRTGRWRRRPVDRIDAGTARPQRHRLGTR